MRVVKTKGRLRALETGCRSAPSTPTAGIGHTRWATHGAPSDANAHPHGTHRLYLVHNGIIENERELREELCARGYRFASQTDTEAAAFLLDSIYQQDGDALSSLTKAAARLRGSYALGVIFGRPAAGDLRCPARQPPDRRPGRGGLHDRLGHTGGSALFARLLRAPGRRDRPASGRRGAAFYDGEGRPIAKAVETIEWNVEAAERGGFKHFMLKEIHEEPQVVRQTLGRYVKDGLPTSTARLKSPASG